MGHLRANQVLSEETQAFAVLAIQKKGSRCTVLSIHSSQTACSYAHSADLRVCCFEAWAWGWVRAPASALRPFLAPAELGGVEGGK